MALNNKDVDNQVDEMLNVLYEIRNDDKFYFFKYGKSMIKELIKDQKNKIK